MLETGAPRPSLVQSGVALLAILLLLLTGRVLYNRFFHPLARFPGPLAASVTNLWKVYHIAGGNFEDVLLDLHRQYGTFVRIGPNQLDISDASAVKAVFGAGRSFKKSAFYDAFTALRPNLFGSRDEEIHSRRRKAVANGFSAQSLASMEIFMDKCMEKLVSRLDRAASSNEIIDLKQWISFFVVDVLGELAFSRPFGVLDDGDESKAPQVYDHVLLATMSGHIPWILPYLRKILPYTPIPRLQRMIQGRNVLRQMAIDSVEKRMAAKSDRKDLLGKLLLELEAGHDSKGHDLDVADVQTEAFGFIVAGSHTTAASTTLLLWHLLHAPHVLATLQAEIDKVARPDDGISYQFKDTNQLKYLQAVINEGFRINPVFVMPLIRVVPPGGTHIAGHLLPEGTDVSICNHVLHHDERVFGPHLDVFQPERWLSDTYDRAAYLMQFGSGHRACLGRNIALAEMQKLVVTLLSRYELVAAAQPIERDLQHGDMPPTRSFGVADLHGPLAVRVQRR